MQCRAKWLSACFLLGVLVTQSRSEQCTGDGRTVIQCGATDVSTEAACSIQRQGGVACCFNSSANANPKCRLDAEKALQNNIGSFQDGASKFESFVQQKGTFEKDKKEDLVKAVNEVPGADSEEVKRELGQSVDPNFNAEAGQRSLSFSFAALALGGGSGFLQSSLFPECPVHVKYCYRVACGGRYDYAKQNDPTQCMSDPTCCYDYKLAFMRSILGEGFMQGTPTCYFGATSNQWKYITKYFLPWTPWKGAFILQVFESIFDTSAYNSVGQFACSITGLRKAYPVGSKSKLECSLVSGCWDEDLPVGSQCYMASSFAQNLFGGLGIQAEVYPSLYTQDVSETQCSANWFDFGPKAYRRMPCGIGPAPDDLLTKLSWCPITDCCLNYASLVSGDFALLSALSGGSGGLGGLSGLSGGLLGGGLLGSVPGLGGALGGLGALGGATGGIPGLGLGGLPGLGGLIPGLGGGTTSNTLLVYLLQGLQGGSTDLSDLFCPYKNLFAGSSSSLFPDLSEYTDGCCEIPDCYHKKKLHGGFTPNPVAVSWGQWSDCSNFCGQGTRTRDCFAGNTKVAAANCGGGPASEPCTGLNCPTIGPPQPVYAQWGVWGQCSETCGPGQRTRRCYYNGQETAPANCGGGPASQQCFIVACPAPPPVSAQWSQWGPCGATCGSGTQSRSCLYAGQATDPSACGFGQATRQCYAGPCPTNPPPVAQWGLWGPCQVSCGSGQRTRSCLYAGQPTSPANCGASGQDTQQCYAGPCPTAPPPVQGNWGGWQPVGGCTKTCGGGTQSWERPCLSNGVQVSSSLCAHTGSVGTAQATCGTPPCIVLPPPGSWTTWRDETTCGASCGSSTSKRQRRSCVTAGGAPANTCPGPSTRDIPCPFVPCTPTGSWTAWTDETSCGGECGAYRVKTQQRSCLTPTGAPATNCQGQSQRVVACPNVPCSQGYHWSGWTQANCQYSGSSCTRKRVRYCYTLSNGVYTEVYPQSSCDLSTEKTETCQPSDCFTQG